MAQLASRYERTRVSSVEVVSLIATDFEYPEMADSTTAGENKFK